MTSRHEARATELGVRRLLGRLTAEPRLYAELQRARREFFGVGSAPAPALPGAADAAELRFAEWFTLERDSDTLGAVPATLPAFAADAQDLADSQAGVYLVQAVGQGGAAAVDLQDDSALELVVPPGSLAVGDLVVGRLFPAAAGQWTPSTAAAIFRPGVELAAAFRRDVTRLDLDRRLWQVEVEHLLLRRHDQARSPTAERPTPPVEHLEADLETLLQAAGSAHAATTISERLATASRPGVVMGPLLDELAFDTTVDLDRARALLLQLWNAHHAGDAPPEAPSEPAAEEPLGARLLRTLDEGLAQQRDVGELFAQLEQMAGIEPAEDEQADGDDEAAEIGGDLGPLVEEFLWETGRSDAPPASPLRLLVELQQNAALPHTDLESVTPTDLMRLLLHVYLGAPPGQRAAHVRAAFAELQAFFAWAVATQEMPVGEVLHGCRGALLDQVDRLQAAGEALTTPAAGGEPPGVLQVEDVGPAGFGVRDDEGAHHWLVAPGAAMQQLRAGDLVLAAMTTPVAASRRTLTGPVVVLPADARTLIE